MTTLTRIIKIEAGASAGSHTDVLNCKSIKWRDNHNIVPQLLPSSKVPVGWLQSHKWIDGEFSLQTMDSVFNIYAPASADAVEIPYFVVSASDTAKNTITYTFDGLLISSIERDLNDIGEPLFVYKFTANYVTEA